MRSRELHKEWVRNLLVLPQDHARDHAHHQEAGDITITDAADGAGAGQEAGAEAVTGEGAEGAAVAKRKAGAEVGTEIAGSDDHQIETTETEEAEAAAGTGRNEESPTMTNAATEATKKKRIRVQKVTPSKALTATTLLSEVTFPPQFSSSYGGGKK